MIKGESSMIKDIYREVFNLSKEQVNVIINNNDTQSLYSFVTLINDIMEIDDIKNIFSKESNILGESLYIAMLRPNGVESILEFIYNKGYSIPEIELNR